jgi:hypothetical protein
MRRHAADNSNAVSLFPFIAVLLCTMGALLVILVFVTRLARDRAQKVAAAELAAPKPLVDDSENRAQLERIRVQMTKLQSLRDKAERQLHDDEMRLAHLEQHMRQLEDEIGGLKRTMAELDALDAEHFDDRRQAERELARLQELIVDTENGIKSIKESQRAKKRSYAVVPYEGPNGTHRRPIYIECRRNEVILQPEGVRLTEHDFVPPLDAGNPLAAAVRAARETMMSEAQFAERRTLDPYPLILVRPDGIGAYYSVRRAIESWDGDFGYEFVDGDWELKFQPADPRLAKAEQQAIEQARIRRRVLAAAAPRAFRTGSEFGAGPFDVATGEDDGRFGSGGDGLGSGSGERTAAAGSEPAEGAATGSSADVIGTGNASGPGGTGNLIQPGEHRPAGDPAVAPEQIAGTQSAGRNAQPAGTGPAGENEPGGAPGGQAAGNSATPSGQAVGTAAGQVATTNGSSASASAEAGQAGVPDAASATDEPHATGHSVKIQSVAGKRGVDWAVDKNARAAIPIRRTIRVLVRNDRFSVLPDDATPATPSSGGREVVLKDSTAAHVDDIVKAVQDHVKNWGIAGDGLYWRPVLLVQTTSGGERRADELEQLLKESGIELRTPSVVGQRAEETTAPR